MNRSDFSYQGLPEEVKRLLNEVHHDLEIALTTNKNNDYGLSRNWIESAMEKLPQDNGVYHTWPEAERRLEE